VIPPERSGAPITSTANPAVSLVRALGRRDHRAAERAFVVEGVRAVRDALEIGAIPRLLLLREGDELAARELPLPAGVSARLVVPRVFDRLSDVQTPQGVLAVFPFPSLQPIEHDPSPLVLVLDRLRDPGNLGALLRAAVGAGVSAVYLSPETVDPWNPKVVRAGMGAHFRLPLLPLDAPAMADLRARLPHRAIATAAASLPYDSVDWTGPSALVIGGEATGVGPELTTWGSEEIAIPLADGLESLNAAVAGAVILFEAARQRRGALR
jgi:TrmH family RNA methyltransferase